MFFYHFQEEWQLVYAYLAGFPNLIERCLEQLERGLCSTHLIIHFLHGLVAIFSVYYRRIRILTVSPHIFKYILYPKNVMIEQRKLIIRKNVII